MSYASDKRKADRLNKKFLEKVEREDTLRGSGKKIRKEKEYRGGLDLFGVEFDTRKINKGKLNFWEWRE
jgi:hypothetical protein